uniref:RING-type domain-containing protein n=1 Tax=Araucaria cunninghamii TaxID=56994 RepID=A0A0D6QX09_ARACU
MNRNQQLEVHYINTGFPYTVTDSFMDLFEGLNYVQADFALAEALQDQESAYWSLQTYSEKHGITGSTSNNSHYGFGQNYEGNQQGTSTRDNTRSWDNHSQINNDQALANVLQETEGPEDITRMMANTHIEECNRGHHVEGNNSQNTWQDNIDPDNMTYEELIELGEAVGTHNRGLCLDLIACLPVSKYKTKFFSCRKKTNDRCVICHMDYKRGDRMITLPCKHPYHEDCITRWLQINKACPVCYVEVFGSSR